MIVVCAGESRLVAGPVANCAALAGDKYLAGWDPDAGGMSRIADYTLSSVISEHLSRMTESQRTRRRGTAAGS